MSTGQIDEADYVNRVTSRAVPGASESVARHGGTVVGTDSWQDDDGHWLHVRLALEDLPGVEVRYARIILLASGPENSPELEATLYGSGLEERVHTKARAIPSLDGVITL